MKINPIFLCVVFFVFVWEIVIQILHLTPKQYRETYTAVEEWLDQFDMFSIYEVLPQILELWGDNLMTEVQAKKGLAEVNGK